MKKKNRFGSLYLSVGLLLIAVAAITAATVAWFSIADTVKVRSMRFEVTTGYQLRFDTVAHDNIEDYKSTLNLADILGTASDFVKNGEYSIPLEPVTTIDGKNYIFENGNVVKSDSGVFMEFVLHFMSDDDMTVHLTSLNSDEAMDGTMVSSSKEGVIDAMRISFMRDDSFYVFDPGMGDRTEKNSFGKVFGLPKAESMTYTDTNAMWKMTGNVDTPVTVRVWLEGTDPECINKISNSDYSIKLRFEGTDKNNNTFTNQRKVVK